MRARSLLACSSLLFVIAYQAGCPSVSCATDDDCGAEQWCWDSVCTQRCAGDDDCAAGSVCDEGGRGCVVREPHDGGVDAGPGALAVSLTANFVVVGAGAEVLLSWQTTPPADECALSAATPFDDGFVAVGGFSPAGEGSGSVFPRQDTQYRMRCTKDDVAGEDTVSVDVTAAATLAATPRQVNDEESSTLSWATNGVASCAVRGPSLFLEDVGPPAGALVLAAPVASGEYAIACDDDETPLASVDVEVARVVIDGVVPSALGPASETVTLSYSYEGPLPSSCVVKEGAAALGDESLDDGHQLTLDDTTTLTVECEGFGGATVSASVEVPRLISDFQPPASEVPYGATGDFTWTAESGASCQLASSVGAVSAVGVVFTEPDSYVLTCTKDGKMAMTGVYVAVSPAFLDGGLTGTLVKDDVELPEADVELRARASVNTTACWVEGQSDWLAPVAMALEGSDGDGVAFTLRLARGALGPATDGAESYSVSCESEPGVTAEGSEVFVWWGEVDPGSLEGFGTSGATMVTGSVDLTGASTPDLVGPLGDTGVTRLEQVGGDVLLMQLAGVEVLKGLESLQRVLRDLEVDANDALVDFSEGGTDGLPALKEVGDDVLVRNHGSLVSVALPSLETVGGFVEVGPNPTLESVSLPSLTETGGWLRVLQNAAVSVVDLASLARVGGDLVVGGDLLEGIQLQSLSNVAGDLLLNTGQLTAVELPALSLAGGDFLIGNSTIQDVALPSLTRIGGKLDLTLVPSLQSISLPELGEVADALLIDGTALVAFSAPSLARVGGAMDITDNPALLALTLTALDEVAGSLTMSGNTALGEISFPACSRVGGDVQVFSNSALDEISIPALTEIAGSVSVQFNGPALSLGAGSLSSIGGNLFCTNRFSAIALDSLADVGGSLTIGGAAGLTSLSLPSLARTGGALVVEVNADMIGLAFASLTQTSALQISGHQGLQSLALPKLQLVIGDLSVSDNEQMDELFLPSLTLVGRDVFVAANGLTSIAAPLLDQVGRDVTILDNADLQSLSLPTLGVVRYLDVINNRPSSSSPGVGSIDLRALSRVEGGFTIYGTGISSLKSVNADGYASFGSLTVVLGSYFTVESNPSLPCGEIRSAYCSLLIRPATYVEQDNLGTCSSPPPCP